MKKIYLLSILMCIFSAKNNDVSAQTSINSSSNQKILNNQIHQYSIGEMVLVNTIHKNNTILTQGYYQPSLIIENNTQNNNNISSSGATIENIKVYPNPTENIVFIEFVSTESTGIAYQLYDATSKMIINKITSQEKGYNKISIDLAPFAAGSYFLIIKKDKKDSQSENYSYKIQKIQ